MDRFLGIMILGAGLLAGGCGVHQAHRAAAGHTGRQQTADGQMTVSRCDSLGRLRHCSPATYNIDSTVLSRCDSVINGTILEKNAPGGVLCIVKDGTVIYEKAYGNRQTVPAPLPMYTSTVFDLASLSKCVGTAIAVMQLAEQKKIDLNAPVDRYLPGYANWHEGKRTVKIRVRDLMTHTGGLAPYIPTDSLAKAWGEFQPDSLRNYIIHDLPRLARPGTRRIYSCPSFVSLQYIVESVTGQKLCDYVQENVFDALGLKDTRYLPIDRPVDQEYLFRIAPTEVLVPGTTARNQISPDTRSGDILLGVVHDPMARRMNMGNSGNAGVFSTADDLAVLCTALMNGGEIDGRRILQARTVRKMFKVQNKKIGRTLGWDATSPYAKFVGERLGKDRCVCHTGYTGTSILMDLDENLAIIFLTNAAHPFDKGSVIPARKAISEIVGEACGK